MEQLYHFAVELSFPCFKQKKVDSKKWKLYELTLRTTDPLPFLTSLLPAPVPRQSDYPTSHLSSAKKNSPATPQ